MKQFLLTIGLVFLGIVLKAQHNGDNFDTVSYEFGYQELLIEFDTTNEYNIWQIGQPQKSVFTQAFSLPNALITDTVNPYPINDTSIFVVKVPNYYSSGWGAQTIAFYYKLNTDSLNDFGKIEVSADNGNTYIDILTQWEYYGFFWTGYSTENLTGNTNDWKYFSICVKSILDSFPEADTIQYRFTFISDSIQTNKDGWMIDDLTVTDITENIKNTNKTSQSICYPNPANKYLFIENNSFTGNDYNIEIYNNKGQLLSITNYNTSKIKINLDKYKNGLYFYRIIDYNKKPQTFNKFVINK